MNERDPKIPAVPLPANSPIRRPVDLKLKPGWRFDQHRRVFVSEAGERVTPGADLPKRSRVVPTVPSLASADEATLSPAERDLRRYIQVILPPGEPPDRYVDAVRAWPCVEQAEVGPEVSLP
jgi:hypothetical protein